MKEIIDIVTHIRQFESMGSLLGWDQEVVMPQKSANQRSDLRAALAGHINSLWKNPRLKTLLEETHSPEEKRMLKAIQREWRHHCCLDQKLVEALSKATSKGFVNWQTSRENNFFEPFASSLKEIVSLSMELSQSLGFSENPYDAHLDLYDPGLTAQTIDPIFDSLKKWTIEWLKNHKQEALPPLAQNFPEKNQRELSQWLLQALAIDPDRTRLDTAPHPFCSTINIDDVRLTTKYLPNDPFFAFYSTLHEAGHGIYELNLPAKWQKTHLGDANFLTVHESQSRFFEIMLGHHPLFTERMYKEFTKAFPEWRASEKEFYQRIYHVHPGYIRIASDPISYNLHVILRFEIEKSLFNGSLAVDDLQDAWNDKVKEYLGLDAPKTLAQGCFQDIHWSHGSFGYFPTYTLGNLFAAGLFESAQKAVPTLENDLSNGTFTPVKEWLAEKIHRHGRFYSTQELILQATGAPLSAEPFQRWVSSFYQ